MLCTLILVGLGYVASPERGVAIVRACYYDCGAGGSRRYIANAKGECPMAFAET